MPQNNQNAQNTVMTMEQLVQRLFDEKFPPTNQGEQVFASVAIVLAKHVDKLETDLRKTTMAAMWSVQQLKLLSEGAPVPQASQQAQAAQGGDEEEGDDDTVTMPPIAAKVTVSAPVPVTSKGAQVISAPVPNAQAPLPTATPNAPANGTVQS